MPVSGKEAGTAGYEASRVRSVAHSNIDILHSYCTGDSPSNPFNFLSCRAGQNQPDGSPVSEFILFTCIPEYCACSLLQPK